MPNALCYKNGCIDEGRLADFRKIKSVQYNIEGCKDDLVKYIRTRRHVVLRVNHSGGHTIDNVQPMCESSRMFHLKCGCTGERVKYHLKVCAVIYFSSE